MSPLINPFHHTTHRNTHFHFECTPKICVPFNQIFNARPAKRSEIFLLLKFYFSKSRLSIPGNSIIFSSKNLNAYFWCMCESFQSQLNAVTCAFQFKISNENASRNTIWGANQHVCVQCLCLSVGYNSTCEETKNRRNNWIPSHPWPHIFLLGLSQSETIKTQLTSHWTSPLFPIRLSTDFVICID